MRADSMTAGNLVRYHDIHETSAARATAVGPLCHAHVPGVELIRLSSMKGYAWGLTFGVKCLEGWVGRVGLRVGLGWVPAGENRAF